ncbi:hypothetical protein OG883_06350 [Streptomyces sp. NBC_01142]|uniref:hypothetical protein n=1 Tax=Streptomyces sp. NBC_01142 TaxID=2975865 RepID=UPI002258F3CC|nr:hypothetical protein [Streptomyces sp. NBC_01142]MCX4819535.1 hypothetical protein [Streptomyces sp. NBC_01142]
MQLTATARSENRLDTSTSTSASPSSSSSAGTGSRPAGERPGTGRDADRDTGRDGDPHDADGMAVAAFVLGLVGLLVMNIVLGPIALVLAGLALWRGTARRARALLGLALGLADLAVLAVLVTMNGTVVWGFGN